MKKSKKKNRYYTFIVSQLARLLEQAISVRFREKGESGDIVCVCVNIYIIYMRN